MRHLSPETLAGLIDERASLDERSHLRECARCARELEGLQEQTDALASSLPAPSPPAEAWTRLETRLREEGLIRDEDRHFGARNGPRGTPARGPARSRTSSTVGRWHRFGGAGPGWLQAAAALLLFFGGAMVGGMVDAPAGSPVSSSSGIPEEAADLAPSESRTVDDAEEALRSAEERYVAALVDYRRLLEDADQDFDGSSDPAVRVAALETLVAASQAAIREAPADPFLNGVLASTMAERQAVLSTLATASGENWF